MGTPLEWRNEAENRTARVSIINESIGIADEAMWDECIDFLADGVNKIAIGLLPVLDDYYSDN